MKPVHLVYLVARAQARAVRHRRPTSGPINQVHPVTDLGTTLRPGADTLTVTVATALPNQLRVARSTLYTQPRERATA